MRIIGTTGIFICLMFVPSILRAQTGSQSRVIYANEKHDVRKWLMENEAALNRGDGCTLTVSWMSDDNRKGASSALHEIASFVVVPEDEEMARVFRDTASSSGLEVRVGVRYVSGGLRPSPPGLEIALALDGPADDVFDEISRSEAATVRYKNWKQVSVVKPILVEHIRYEFALTCENGRTFLSFLRHPAKQRVHAE